MQFSDAELQTARDMLAANPRAGRETLARLLGCSTKRARNILRELRETGMAMKLSGPGEPGSHGRAASEPRLTESDEVCGDKRTITKSTRERVDSVDDLIRVCKIDTTEWEIERQKIVRSEVGMKPVATTEWVKTKDGRRIPAWVRDEKDPITHPLCHITVWLRRNHVIASIARQVEEFQRKAENYAPKYPAIIFRDLKRTGNLAEISVYDHHFGALIWGKETGWADWDLKLSDHSFREAVETLLTRVRGYGLDRIMLSLGNDLQNSDNRAGTTEAGTPQDNDGRYEKVCGIVQDAAVWAIEACREMVPEVIVPMVRGNHDPLTTFHLGGYLTAWFRNCPGVVIDNSPLARKAYQHGTVMLMLTHGKGIKTAEYPLLMAMEHPRMWADTTWRETHTGHIHTRRSMVPELDELKGVAVRSLPSLRPPCEWSAGGGMVGNMRSAEAFVFNDREGLIGTAVYSVPGKAA